MNKTNANLVKLIDETACYLLFNELPFKEITLLLSALNTKYGPRQIVEGLVTNMECELKREASDLPVIEKKKFIQSVKALKPVISKLPTGKIRTDAMYK